MRDGGLKQSVANASHAEDAHAAGPVSPIVGPSIRVALVHDFLLDLRGAERVFLEMCAIWPRADVFTAVYDVDGTEGRFAHRTVHTSPLQRLRPTARTFRALLPLYPAAVRSLDLSDYDLVITSSSGWAHGVRPGAAARHVSYCHNPFRYAWSERDATLRRRPRWMRPPLGGVLDRWRQWDVAVAQGVDRYVANAAITQRRIREYFGRDARIVHPPVCTDRFTTAAVSEHYVTVGELMAHKQIDVVISAFNRLRRPLLIVGDGPEYRRLKRLAGPSVTFTGRLSDDALTGLLPSARALVTASVEEFGITAVEAQASGRPVIARGEGGALETVLDGVTGRLWTGGSEQLADAIRGFDDSAVDPQTCRRSAARFDTSVFRRRLQAEVSLALEGARPTPAAERRDRLSTGGARAEQR